MMSIMDEIMTYKVIPSDVLYKIDKVFFYSLQMDVMKREQ